MNAGGDGSTERRRRGPRNRWRRRTHHPFSACLRLLKGELYPERNRYRDVLILILVVVTAWAVTTAVDASNTARRATATAGRATATATAATATAHHALGLVQEGRSTSIGVICAVQSAIGEAGKETIESSVLPSPLSTFLEQHGFPPAKVRKVQAAQAARRYIGAIGAHIAKELRQRGKSTKLVPKLLRRDGTIDCRELAAISNVHVR